VSWYVQVASVVGIVAHAEQGGLPMFTTEREAAGAAARMTADQEHLYGWHTVAKVDDARVARAMAALVGHGIQGDGSMIGRALNDAELAAEAKALSAARRLLWTLRKANGRFLERVVRLVLDSVA
jgi:hypothetical protein